MEFDFLLYSTFQLGYLLLIIFCGGLLIDLIESKSNYYLRKTIGYAGIILTCLGTVVHELSHLVFVILGCMKPTEIKLFRPIGGYFDGNLGYVNSTYNKRNLYSRAFLFFVGIAPIIGGTIVILVSLKFCIPKTFDILMNNIDGLSYAENIFTKELIASQIAILKTFIVSLLTIENFKTISFWVFLFIVLSVGSHMSLSKADIHGAIKGLPIIYVTICIVNLALVFCGVDSQVSKYYFMIISSYTIIFLSIAIMFSIANFILCFLINKIVNLIRI